MAKQMKTDLFSSLEAHDTTDEDRILRAPFIYIGSKRKSLKNILPALPYRKTFIEVFGGSGVVLLNRRPSSLDVYNDRFGGVVCFYRCIKDSQKLDALIEWLELTCFSKEDYYFCRDTWKDCQDPVERAGRWYYSMQNSFGGKGKQWGRKVSGGSQAQAISNKLMSFSALHQRLKTVQIENCSWEKILQDYDSEDAVFYLDPPYVGTSNDGYHHAMSHDDHRKMIHIIQGMKGFVALSGYANSLYDQHPWDDRISWDVTCTLGGNANTEGNKKAHLKGLETYGRTEEVLWIKE